MSEDKDAAIAFLRDENRRNLASWSSQVSTQREEIARLRSANENNLAGWSNDRAGLSGKIARLEAEVASLRKERDEARGNAERYAADILRVMAQRDEARSHLSALAAAASGYRDAERSRWSALFALEGRQVVEGADHRPEVWPEMRAYDESVGVLGERRRALDALLSGEEG